ncbi:MAG: helix-turn-helix transcriptional regulator [Lachnospiraceae bacterium]
MIIKGMQAWIDYIARQFDIACEKTPWSDRYSVSEKSGRGFAESFTEPGLWAVWTCDFVLNQELKASYIQDDLQYISFAYRESPHLNKMPAAVWPGNEVLDVGIDSGFSMRAVNTYLFLPFFERFTTRDVMDFIASIQSYDEAVIMKQLPPILRQILEHHSEGLALRVFVESRVLEIISVLISISEQERKEEKVALSAFDTGQLYKVLDILENRMADPPSISELSRIIALNEYKLKTGFRQIFGTTIYEHLRLLRMEKAADLLKNQQLSVTEVGQLVGYETPHGFNNAFRRYYGTTPGLWQIRQNQ